MLGSANLRGCYTAADPDSNCYRHGCAGSRNIAAYTTTAVPEQLTISIDPALPSTS